MLCGYVVVLQFLNIDSLMNHAWVLIFKKLKVSYSVIQYELKSSIFVTKVAQFFYFSLKSEVMQLL